MKAFTTATFCLLAVCWGLMAPAAPVTVCENLVFTSPLEDELTANERSFLCPDQADRRAWRQVPANQKRFHLTRFLQDRGHLVPEFEVVSGNVLQVTPGPRIRVTSYELTKDAELPSGWFRAYEGQWLTPQLLSAIEKELSAVFQQQGHPCVTATARVPEPGRGHVVVDVEPGRIGHFHRDRIHNSQELRREFPKEIFSRYFAFVDGQEYDERLTLLTSRRLEQSGLVQSAFFVPNCPPDPLSLEIRGSTSPPRLFRLGLGLDTEGLFRIRSSWRHNQLGDLGSQFEAALEASRLQQEIEASMRWYLVENSRFHLMPSLRLIHEDRPKYRSATLKAQFHPATTVETRDSQIEMSAGPSLELVRTFEGAGAGDTFLPQFEVIISVMSHFYELGLPDPQQGTYARADIAVTDQSMGSGVSGRRLRIAMKHVLSPLTERNPMWSIALRAGVATTYRDSGVLPPTYRFFLGGSDTLRGYGIQEIDAGGAGALTRLYFGWENRFPNLLPFNLVPLLFTDVGMISPRSGHLQPPVYLSPGFGLRWNSPIGIIRATLAHGVQLGEAPDYRPVDPHLQFFIGLGEDF